MWAPSLLKLPPQVEAVNCAVVDVNPWTFGAGRVEESGHYLSPENAVNYLAGKLIQSGHSGDVVVFMLAATQQNLFIQSLSAVNEIFPAAAFKQAERRIKSEMDLVLNRLQKPAGFVPPLTMAPLAVPTLQKIINFQASSPTGSNSGIDDLMGELKAFKATQAAEQAAKLAEIDKLKSRTAPAFVFTSTGTADRVVSLMKRNIPAMDSIYTVAVMFLAPDLAALRRLIT